MSDWAPSHPQFLATEISAGMWLREQVSHLEHLNTASEL